MKSKNSYQQPKRGYPQRVRKQYSESIRREKVRELEQGLVTVTELSRSLGIGRTTVYRWLNKYSVNYEPQELLIMESKSETKKVLRLEERVKMLERLLGQKQIQLEFSEKMIEIASDELGIDLKKKFGTKLLAGSGRKNKEKGGLR